MRLIISLIFISICLICCDRHNDFEHCLKDKELLSSKNTIPISLDSFQTSDKLDLYFEQVKDTTNNTLDYGFIYNYKDSNFIPNKDSRNNILISSFSLDSKGNNYEPICGRGVLSLTILSQDSIELDTFRIALKGNLDRLERIIDIFYKRKFDNFNNDKKAFISIHIWIKEDINFNKTFLPIFRIIYNCYIKDLKGFINSKFKKNLCELDKDNYLIGQVKLILRIDKTVELIKPIINK
jgi:hypothetical protein